MSNMGVSKRLAHATAGVRGLPSAHEARKSSATVGDGAYFNLTSSGSSPARQFSKWLAIFISATGSANFLIHATPPPYATPQTAQAGHRTSQGSQSNRFGGNLLCHCMRMTRCDAVFGIAAAAVAAGPRTCIPTRRTSYSCATRASLGHPPRDRSSWEGKVPICEQKRCHHSIERYLEPMSRADMVSKPTSTVEAIYAALHNRPRGRSVPAD